MPSVAAVCADTSSISSKEQFLIAASELMIERHSIDVSLSDIAKKAGLNAALVKYYFNNKAGLLLALVEYILKPGLNQMEGMIDMDLEPVAKLKLHVKGIITVYFRYPFVNRLIHSLFENLESGRVIAEIINRPLAVTQRKLLEQGVDAGLFRKVDPMAIYFIVLGACDHLFFGKQILGAAFDVKEIDENVRRSYTDSLLDILLNGLLTPQARVQ